MRREVEGPIKHLTAASDQGLATTTELIDQYTSLIKQSWALTRWLKNKLEERQRAVDEAAPREITAQCGTPSAAS
jgi:hypothetical protein